VFQQYFPEARGMRDRQSDVLIEMKDFNFGPIDASFVGKCLKKVDLGRTSRYHNACATMDRNCLANSGGRMIGRGLAQGLFVIEYFQHSGTSQAENKVAEKLYKPAATKCFKIPTFKAG
jgi:hypothetical protein